jgi:hypothetical protein
MPVGGQVLGWDGWAPTCYTAGVRVVDETATVRGDDRCADDRSWLRCSS